MNRIKEIQGLRAVAAVLVAVYHIWFGRVSGGVDAFFVIAAFFLVASFARLDRPYFADVVRYYASTLRRVVPAATVLIFCTIVASRFFLSSMDWPGVVNHALASTFFVENWQLAAEGVEYLNDDLAPLPLQQMWALSLQMQFYILLPLALLALASIAARMRVSVKFAWTVGLAVMGGLSFAYNIWIVGEHQPWAYFDSLARGWEFILGGLLALHLDRVPPLSKSMAKLLGYACLLVLVSFAAVVQVSSAFPGYAALVPVLSTVGLIIAAKSGAKITLLNNAPMQALGEISFSFYLWHWPLLIFWRQISGETIVGAIPGLAIIGLAGLLAWLSVRLIETPFRRWQSIAIRPGVSMLACLATMLPTLLAVYLSADANQHIERDARIALAAFHSDPAGWKRDTPIIPDPLIARYDLPNSDAEPCHQSITASELIECVFGVEDGIRTVVLVGGSHSRQWLPALEDIAPALGLRIISLSKSACLFFDSTQTDDAVAVGRQLRLTAPASCIDWNAAAEARILELAPDLVITIGSRGRGEDEAVPDLYKSLWARLGAAGISILALRDNPWFLQEVVRCVDQRRQEPSKCNEPREDLIANTSPGLKIDAPNVRFADLSDLFCDSEQCWIVRDGVLLYRDRNHLTASFVRTQASRLRMEVEAAMAIAP